MLLTLAIFDVSANFGGNVRFLVILNDFVRYLSLDFAIFLDDLRFYGTFLGFDTYAIFLFLCITQSLFVGLL